MLVLFVFVYKWLKFNEIIDKQGQLNWIQFSFTDSVFCSAQKWQKMKFTEKQSPWISVSPTNYLILTGAYCIQDSKREKVNRNDWNTMFFLLKYWLNSKVFHKCNVTDILRDTNDSIFWVWLLRWVSLPGSMVSLFGILLSTVSSTYSLFLILSWCFERTTHKYHITQKSFYSGKSFINSCRLRLFFFSSKSHCWEHIIRRGVTMLFSAESQVGTHWFLYLS